MLDHVPRWDLRRRRAFERNRSKRRYHVDPLPFLPGNYPASSRPAGCIETQRDTHLEPQHGRGIPLAPMPPYERPDSMIAHKLALVNTFVRYLAPVFHYRPSSRPACLRPALTGETPLPSDTPVAGKGSRRGCPESDSLQPRISTMRPKLVGQPAPDVNLPFSAGRPPSSGPLKTNATANPSLFGRPLRHPLTFATELARGRQIANDAGARKCIGSLRSHGFRN
jgi:hypothetical protein